MNIYTSIIELLNKICWLIFYVFCLILHKMRVTLCNLYECDYILNEWEYITLNIYAGSRT